jgi:hypothetical protein
MFKYKDFVKVTGGFLEGFYGVLVGFSKESGEDPTYDVKFFDVSEKKTHVAKGMFESWLKKVDLPKELDQFIYNLWPSGWELTHRLKGKSLYHTCPEMVFDSDASKVFDIVIKAIQNGSSFEEVDNILLRSAAKANYALRGISKTPPYSVDESTLADEDISDLPKDPQECLKECIKMFVRSIPVDDLSDAESGFNTNSFLTRPRLDEIVTRAAEAGVKVKEFSVSSYNWNNTILAFFPDQIFGPTVPDSVMVDTVVGPVKLYRK